MYSLDPDFLRTFLAISETGGFASAAEQVNKTQSTVSAQVKRLEEILDTRLFEKIGRRNALTNEGRKLMEYARAMVRLNDEAVRSFRPPEVSGAVKIGTTDDYAQAFLPETLTSFARTHPAIEVEIVTGPSRLLEPQLEAENFDAVILLCQPGDMDMEILRTDRLHWIGAYNATVQFDDPLPLALWANGCAWRDMALASLAQAGRDWRIAYTTSNAPLLASTVRRQLGITVAPDWFAVDNLYVLDEMDRRYPLGTADIGIKLRAGEPSPALAAFVTHLRDHMVPLMRQVA